MQLALIYDGFVHGEATEADRALGIFDIRDVSEVPGIAPGWIAHADHSFSAPVAPIAPTPDTAQLLAYAGAARRAEEEIGIVIGGITVATDTDSQNRIANAFVYLQTSGAASVDFKASSGWTSLAADQLKAVALAVGQHVQGCFTKQRTIDAQIVAGEITTFAQIDQAFAAAAA